MAQLVPLESLPAAIVHALKELYGAGPPGKFLRGKDGITHFHLEEPENPSQRPRIAVLSHGIGTSMGVFDGTIRQGLLKAGFRVLRYDFLGHGWSVADETFMRYDKEMMLTQLSELLDHVLAPGEPVDLFMGHSTGGIVGVFAAMSIKQHPVRELALISPAFWANKPVIAQLADKIPEFMHWLVRSVGPLKKLPQDAYLENNDVSWGKVDKKYLYPKEQQLAKENIQKMFQKHPQAIGGILGIATFFLREDLLGQWRTELKEFLSVKEASAPRICLLWGKYDVVVPFQYAADILAWAKEAGNPERVTLVGLELGHESVVEDPETILKETLQFAQLPSRM